MIVGRRLLALLFDVAVLFFVLIGWACLCSNGLLSLCSFVVVRWLSCVVVCCSLL